MKHMEVSFIIFLNLFFHHFNIHHYDDERLYLLIPSFIHLLCGMHA